MGPPCLLQATKNSPQWTWEAIAPREVVKVIQFPYQINLTAGLIVTLRSQLIIFFSSFFLFLVFDTGSHYIALAILGLSM